MRSTNPQNLEVVKVFPSIRKYGLKYLDDRSTVANSSNNCLHLHIPRTHKMCILLGAEFTFSLLQDHVLRHLASTNS